MIQRVLFLCTGNYYRSRFAEQLFNHHVAKAGLPWRADSRALAIELGVNNVGPISPHTVARLQTLGISLAEPPRMPQQVSETDLAAATIIIALDRTEHEPYVKERLPDWVDVVDYWEVADLHALTADDALGRIERAVTQLVRDLEA